MCLDSWHNTYGRHQNRIRLVTAPLYYCCLPFWFGGRNISWFHREQDKQEIIYCLLHYRCVYWGFAVFYIKCYNLLNINKSRFKYMRQTIYYLRNYREFAFTSLILTKVFKPLDETSESLCINFLLKILLLFSSKNRYSFNQ